MIFSTPRTYAKKSDRNAAQRRPSILEVSPSPLAPHQGIIRHGHLTIRCALGRSGIRSMKKEGDGGTPRAAMGLIGGYIRSTRRPLPPTRLPLAPVRPGLGWCDDPKDASYNRPVRLPFKASHEQMFRTDRLYDVCIVMDWNVTCRKRGAGSAIFLHIAKPGYSPTEGCIAVSPRDMNLLLPRLSTGVTVVIGRQFKRPPSR